MAIFSLSRRIYEPEAPISASGSNYNPRNTSMYSCMPRRSGRLYWGGYNFRLSLRGVGPTLRPVSPTGWKRGRRLDLGKNISFSDSLLVRISTLSASPKYPEKHQKQVNKVKVKGKGPHDCPLSYNSTIKAGRLCESHFLYLLGIICS